MFTAAYLVLLCVHVFSQLGNVLRRAVDKVLVLFKPYWAVAVVEHKCYLADAAIVLPFK